MLMMDVDKVAVTINLLTC